MTSRPASTSSHVAVPSKNDVSDRIDEIKLAPSTTQISISPELFEKLYLNPKVAHAQENATNFANPTPLGFLGFTISTFTFSMVLMGWGGANGFNAIAGMFLFTGPLLLVLCLIALFLQSQFFPMLLCGFFAMFWLSFGLLQLPSLGLAASYAPPGTPLDKAAAVGAATPEFNAVVGLYVVVWAVFLLTFWVFSFRVNLVLNAILGLSGVSVSLISTSYFKASVGNWGAAATLNKTAGAMLFVVALLGWYTIVSITAVEMRWSFQFPVGDLSHFWGSADVEIGELEKANEGKRS